MNVTDLAKDHPAIEVTDAGNGHDDRIIETHDLCHFSLHSGDLLIQKLNLSITEVTWMDRAWSD